MSGYIFIFRSAFESPSHDVENTDCLIQRVQVVQFVDYRLRTLEELKQHGFPINDSTPKVIKGNEI